MIRLRIILIPICLAAVIFGSGGTALDLQALLLGVYDKVSDECPLSENEKENRWELEEEEKLPGPMVSCCLLVQDADYECHSLIERNEAALISSQRQRPDHSRAPPVLG